MRRITRAAGILAAAVTALTIFWVVGHSERLKSDDAKSAPAVRTVRYVAAEGRVVAQPGYEVEVGSELEGRIAEFFVEEGTHVRKGDVIARIEDAEIRVKLTEAEAELAAARAKYREVASGARGEELRRADATFAKAAADAETAGKEAERYRLLYRQGIVSRSALDEMERLARVASARQTEAAEERELLRQGPKKDTVAYYEKAAERAAASMGYVRSILNKTRIAAPISGTIIRKYLEQGEMVNREVQPYLVAVADTAKIRVSAEVDETDVGRFKVGDPADVMSAAYPGIVFSGRVQEIADYAGIRTVTPNNPARNRDMKIVQVKIELQEKTQLRLGMTVDVLIRPGG